SRSAVSTSFWLLSDLPDRLRVGPRQRRELRHGCQLKCSTSHIQAAMDVLVPGDQMSLHAGGRSEQSDQRSAFFRGQVCSHVVADLVDQWDDPGPDPAVENDLGPGASAAVAASDFLQDLPGVGVVRGYGATVEVAFAGA